VIGIEYIIPYLINIFLSVDIPEKISKTSRISYFFYVKPSSNIVSRVEYRSRWIVNVAKMGEAKMNK
jgi:hypothetical protein